MKTATRVSKLTIILSLIFLAGCGTHRIAGLEHYSEDEIAVLEIPYPAGYSGIFITHIDCKDRAFGWHKRFELAPGWRVITFMGNSQLYVPPNPKNYVFHLEPGGLYTFDRNYQHRSDDWVIDIIDQKTSEPILSQWHWADYSYWNGAEPDSVLCEMVAEMNQESLVAP